MSKNIEEPSAYDFFLNLVSIKMSKFSPIYKKGIQNISSRQIQRRMRDLEQYYEKLVASVRKKKHSSDAMTKLEEVKRTPFRLRVWAACSHIPKGVVTSYQCLANVCLCHHCPRAIGQALRHNPFNPYVPCHRVVDSKGHLCGFAGQREGPKLDIKKKKLLQEGVNFVADQYRVHPECIIYLKRRS